MWGAIIAGAGMLMGASSSNRTAGFATDTAGINANLVSQGTAEESRRLLKDIRQSEGLMGAMSAASGVQTSGSRDLFIKDTKKENRAQLSWLQRAGVQKEKVIRRGGQLQASQLKSQAQMQTIKGFGQIAQGIYSNYNTGP